MFSCWVIFFLLTYFFLLTFYMKRPYVHMFTVPVYSKWCDSLAILIHKFHVLIADLLLPNQMIRFTMRFSQTLSNQHVLVLLIISLGSKLSGQYCYFLYTKYANVYWHQILVVLWTSLHGKNWIEIENIL